MPTLSRTIQMTRRNTIHECSTMKGIRSKVLDARGEARVISNGQRDAAQTEMPVRGPAGRASALAHDANSMGVGQSELLIGVLLHRLAYLAQLAGVERANGERGQSANKREKLQ